MRPPETGTTSTRGSTITTRSSWGGGTPGRGGGAPTASCGPTGTTTTSARLTEDLAPATTLVAGAFLCPDVDQVDGGRDVSRRDTKAHSIGGARVRMSTGIRSRG